MPTKAEMEAFHFGEQSYARGAEKEDNPYGDGTGKLSLMWECGWVSASCKRFVSPDTSRDTSVNRPQVAVVDRALKPPNPQNRFTTNDNQS